LSSLQTTIAALSALSILTIAIGKYLAHLESCLRALAKVVDAFGEVTKTIRRVRRQPRRGKPSLPPARWVITIGLLLALQVALILLVWGT
jgi:hypothetical protein